MIILVIVIQNSTFMTFIRQTFDNLLHLLYPEICLVCEKKIVIKEEAICVSCKYDLPQTNFHQFRENLLEQRLKGRILLKAATSLYYFKKGGKVQQLLHLLKYGNKPYIGVRIGELYGRSLLESDDFQDVDSIIPVPLESHRMRWRGYNQSERFAYGLSISMQKPVDEILTRSHFSASQTRKSAIQRVDNVHSAFQLRSAKALENRHVLLVDDVVTTGATLEACAYELEKIPNLRLSIATIAVAM